MAEGMHLYIHLSELDNNSAMADGTGGKSNTNKSEDGSAKNIQRAAKGLVSYATVSATANKLISYQINQVSLQTGAAEYEQRLQTQYSIAKQVVDTGVSLGIGIATGTWPLVLAGIFVSGISKAIDISQKQNKLRTERNLEDISISMQRIRAGTAGRRGGNQ